jgi:hypothetical protein
VKNNFIKDCQLLHLPKLSATSGNITSLNNGIDLPFDIKRVFYIYDVPSGESRGAHAHYKCHQLLIAATGSFEVEVNDGIENKTFFLNTPDKGLHIPPGIWASELDFSGSSICLVLASEEYSESDYIRDYEGFLKFKNEI